MFQQNGVMAKHNAAGMQNGEIALDAGDENQGWGAAENVNEEPIQISSSESMEGTLPRTEDPSKGDIPCHGIPPARMLAPW
jgi:hypothetical protein